MKGVVLVAMLALVGCEDRQSAYVKSITDHRAELHREFTDPKTSPLPPEEVSSFDGLHFYEVDSHYRVTAFLERTPGTDTFTMPATGDKTRDYVTFAIAHFELKGKPLQLSLYQQVETGSAYMFIPFKDLTNGEATYGGGRFIDCESVVVDSMVIDFNLAYNPYCAYNPMYSCPIPPAENHLAVAIEAGEKDYGLH